jgi:hypothetical protein
MKKLLLIPAISMSLLAADTLDTTTDSTNTVGTQERTYWEMATFKPKEPLSDEELKKRVIYTNVIGAGVIALWGTAFWDYFTVPPIANSEGWFEGEGTKYGGADKFGHMYSTYLWSLGFSSLYEYWGMSEDDALLYGPLTSWIFQGMMEIGDSFSETEGFSYEDLIMNTAGAAFYYVREKYPEVKRKLDFRLEYIPDLNSNVDFFTQYNSMKYSFALKFSGFDAMEDTPMKYFEMQVGYYTRGYQDPDNYDSKERVAYVGVGINSSEVLKAMGWKRTSKIFNYYQLPYTYVPFGYDFDSNSYVAPYSQPYYGNKK